MRYHRNKRKAPFVPGNNCPVSLDTLDNYRRTIIRRSNRNNEDLVEQYHDLDKNQQKRVLQDDAWTGETWFKVIRQSAATRPPAAKLRTQAPQQQQPQQSTQAAHQPMAPQLPAQAETQQQTTNREPLFRHTTKKPPPTTTAIPGPQTMTPNSDYWIREGHLWKRVHTQPRTTLYVPERSDDGPDIEQLICRKNNNGVTIRTRKRMED